jgi:uncharacterized protein with HEPN domain
MELRFMDNVKNDKYYIEKIIKDLNFILENAGGFTQIQLQNNEILIDSIMFRLIQVSENSDKLKEEFKEKYNTIPWRAIKGMRNRIVHEYGNVDFSVVYQTVQKDIPVILEKLKKV